MRICSAHALLLLPAAAGWQEKTILPARRLGNSGDLARSDDRDLHDVRRLGGAGARRAVRRLRPVVRLDQIFIRPFAATDERHGDFFWPALMAIGSLLM